MATQPKPQQAARPQGDQAATPRPQASPEVLQAARETAPAAPAPGPSAGLDAAAIEAEIRAEIRARVEAEIRGRVEAEVRAEVRAEVQRTLPKELDDVGGQKMRDMDKALREASAAANQEALAIARARVVLQRGKKPPEGFVGFVTRRAMDVDAQHIPGYTGEGRSVEIGAGELIQLPEAVAASLEANGAGQIVG